MVYITFCVVECSATMHDIVLELSDSTDSAVEEIAGLTSYLKKFKTMNNKVHVDLNVPENKIFDVIIKDSDGGDAIQSVTLDLGDKSIVSRLLLGNDLF